MSDKIRIDYGKLMDALAAKGISRKEFTELMTYSESWLDSVKRRGWILEDDAMLIRQKAKIERYEYEIHEMTKGEAAEILIGIRDWHYRNTQTLEEEALIFAANYLAHQEEEERKNVGTS